MADLGSTTIYGDLTINSSIGGAVRVAYCSADAPHSTTMNVYLDTDGTGESVSCNFMINDNGSYLDEATPRLYDGDEIIVMKIGGSWYCTTMFAQTTDSGSALMPKIVYIPDQALADATKEDFTHANWNVQAAIIKAVKVVTTSTDWDLLISCHNDQSSGMFSTVKIGQGLSGNQVILLDLPYIDDEGLYEMHMQFDDNGGSAGATVDIYGVEGTE